MKNSIFRTTFAAALLVTPAFVAAQSQDSPKDAPKAPAQGPAGPMTGHPGMMAGGMGPMNPMMMKMRPGAAQGPMTGMRQRRDLKAELGLSDVQQADLRKAREAGQKDRILKQAAARVARMELKSLLRADKVDDKAVAAKLAEVQAAQGALLKIRVDQALAMKRILTPEQQKKLQSMRADRGGRRMGRAMGRRAIGRRAMGRRMMRGPMNGAGGAAPMGPGAGRGRMGRPAGHPGGDDLELDDQDIR